MNSNFGNFLIMGAKMFFLARGSSLISLTLSAWLPTTITWALPFKLVHWFWTRVNQRYMESIIAALPSLLGRPVKEARFLPENNVNDLYQRAQSSGIPHTADETSQYN